MNVESNGLLALTAVALPAGEPNSLHALDSDSQKQAG